MSGAALWAALAALALAYAASARRARGWPARRAGLWLGGLAALGAALGSGLADAAQRSMQAHMAQHLLLVDVAAPLLVGAAPLALALRAAGAARRPLGAVLGARWLALALHPAVVLVAFGAVLLATHVPAAYDSALDRPLLHAGEHAAYLGSALALWAVVLGVRPLPRRRSPIVRVLVALAAMPPMTLASVALANSTRGWYRHYDLGDQRRAGQLMWLGGSAPIAAVTLGLIAAAAGEEERRQRRREAAAARRPQGGLT